MYKSVSIELLPNNNSRPSKNAIWKHVITNEMSLWQDVMSVDKNWYPFDLYFFISDLSSHSNENTIIINNTKMVIIATTNDELFSKPDKPNFGSYMSFSLGVNLPSPTKEFIELYCKQGGMNSVEIEYETLPIQYSSKVAYDGNYEGYCPICKDYSHWMGSDGMRCYKHEKPKIYDGNFIGINIKKTFSRDEVEQLLLQREQHIQENFAPNKTILNINTWIDQNLT